LRPGAILFDFVRKTLEAKCGDASLVDPGDDGPTNPSDAVKYVFPARTTLLCETAVRDSDAMAPFLTMPDRCTWLEFDDDGVQEGAFVVVDRETLQEGTLLYVCRSKLSSRNCYHMTTSALNLSSGGLAGPVRMVPDRFLRRFLGAVALLGAPSLVETRPVRHSRNVNTRRAARGKRTFADHEVVDLRLTRYDRELERQYEESRKPSETGTHGKRRFHFVRAHLRWLPASRKLVKIPPHHRGDISLGTSPSTYVVRY
jgi:hypothetical protein